MTAAQRDSFVAQGVSLLALPEGNVVVSPVS